MITVQFEPMKHCGLHRNGRSIAFMLSLTAGIVVFAGLAIGWWCLTEKRNGANAPGEDKTGTLVSNQRAFDHEEEGEPAHGVVVLIPEVEPNDAPATTAIEQPTFMPTPVRAEMLPFPQRSVGTNVATDSTPIRLPPSIGAKNDTKEDSTAPMPLPAIPALPDLASTPFADPQVPADRQSVSPFAPAQARLPVTGVSAPEMPGNAAVPTTADLELAGKYCPGMRDPSHTIDVLQGRTRLMKMTQMPKRIHVSVPEALTCTIIGTNDLAIVGNRVGTAVLNVWFVGAEDPGKKILLSYLVRIYPDPETKIRVTQVFKSLEAEINGMFPHSQVQLKFVGDALIVWGHAHDRREAGLILSVVTANAAAANQAEVQPPPGVYPGIATSAGTAPALHPAAKVIDMLSISDEPRVNVKVAFVEVNRSAANRFGSNYAHSNQAVCLNSGLVLGEIGTLQNLRCANCVAEPRFAAQAGQAVNLKSSGQFPAATGNNASSIPYEVHLTCACEGADQDHLRLHVSAAANTSDARFLAAVGSPVQTGLNLRQYDATVEIREGQTFVLSGIVQSSGGTKHSPFPWMRGPVGEQELVILLTPEFTHAARGAETPPPTFEVIPARHP
jgi:Flp pilus assembly secretin CpaC